MKSMGDAVSGRLSDSLASDDDPELVRSAIPFSLKLVESLIDENPDDPGLRLTASKGFSQYAYAFIQQEADFTEDRTRAQALRAEAARLFLRGRDHGLRALDKRYPGFPRLLKDDPAKAVAKLSTKDVPIVYWTAVGWAGALSASHDVLMLPQIPQFEALMERALALDEAYNQGAIHVFFASFEMNSPTRKGNKAARAKGHFERAIALSEGKLAAPYVSYAENVLVAEKNRSEFDSVLKTALKIDPNGQPGERLQNIIFQRRAKWLLAREKDLFK